MSLASSTSFFPGKKGSSVVSVMDDFQQHVVGLLFFCAVQVYPSFALNGIPWFVAEKSLRAVRDGAVPSVLAESPFPSFFVFTCPLVIFLSLPPSQLTLSVSLCSPFYASFLLQSQLVTASENGNITVSLEVVPSRGPFNLTVTVVPRGGLPARFLFFLMGHVSSVDSGGAQEKR